MRKAMAVVVVAVWCVVPGHLAAQDRMPPIPGGTLTDAQKRAVEAFRAARSTEPFGPFIPLLRSPEVMQRARAMGDYLRYASVLPPRLSELVILIIARQWSQQYEWSVHAPAARQAGVAADTIQAVADGRRPDHMTRDEDVVYTFCDELLRNRSVSDATYARAKAALGEQGIIDTIGLSGYYTMMAMVLNTARTPLDPGATPGLAPLPR